MKVLGIIVNLLFVCAAQYSQAESITILEGTADLFFVGTVEEARAQANSDLNENAMEFCTENGFQNYTFAHSTYNIPSGSITGLKIGAPVTARAQIICSNPN